jgi:hypothetical protein
VTIDVDDEYVEFRDVRMHGDEAVEFVDFGLLP